MSTWGWQKPLHRKGLNGNSPQKRAPRFWGFWEHLIGLTKTALKKILCKTHATLESLQTIVDEIEVIFNDHPLTYEMSNCPWTNNSITHVLHSRSIVALPHLATEDDIHDPGFGDTSEIKSRNKKQAHTVHCIIKHFQSH